MRKRDDSWVGRYEEAGKDASWVVIAEELRTINAKETEKRERKRGRGALGTEEGDGAEKYSGGRRGHASSGWKCLAYHVKRIRGNVKRIGEDK